MTPLTVETSEDRDVSTYPPEDTGQDICGGYCPEGSSGGIVNPNRPEPDGTVVVGGTNRFPSCCCWGAAGACCSTVGSIGDGVGVGVTVSVCVSVVVGARSCADGVPGTVVGGPEPPPEQSY